MSKWMSKADMWGLDKKKEKITTEERLLAIEYRLKEIEKKMESTHIVQLSPKELQMAKRAFKDFEEDRKISDIFISMDYCGDCGWSFKTHEDFVKHIPSCKKRERS